MLPDDSLCLAYVAAPDKECALRLARGLVEKELAACVNIIAIDASVYRWDGKISESGEYLLLAKTLVSRYASLQEWVVQNHPYDTPCVVRIDAADALPAFSAWIEGAVDKRKI
ncbi:MAG: divalent-cation tolerance protein CutA [Rickettsiales bacterium]